MKTAELDNILRTRFGASEDWDADGIQIDCGNCFGKAAVALDCTTGVIMSAIDSGCGCIVTHHPLIFNPLERVSVEDSVGMRVAECIKNGISVLSYHTCFDIAEGGVADCLCEAAGLIETVPLENLGRIGETTDVLSFSEFRKNVAASLGTDILCAVNATDKVKVVAVIPGSGGKYLPQVLASGADTFLTGEVPHNVVIDCAELGINLICGTHYATENYAMRSLCETVGSVLGDSVLFDSGTAFR